jgi:signal peptide peptidase SppA
MSYIATLLASPWALRRELMPLATRVLVRLSRGETISAEDRQAVEAGREVWAARTKQSQGYAGDTAVIGIYGVMTQRGEAQDLSTPTASSSRIANAVRQAAADPAVGAIVLDIDSPGGSVYGIQELGDVIYQARQAKPVLAVANSLAASAAFWAGSQASEFYAAPGGEVGSVGVYAMHVDYSEALKKEGVAVSYISAGKFKVEGNPYQPLDDAARAAVQTTIDGYYSDFVRAVARGRNVSQTSVRQGMGQGRVLLAGPAQAEKMIDGVRTLGEVVALAAKRSGGPRADASTFSSIPSVAHAQRLVLIAELECDETWDRIEEMQQKGSR